MQRSLIIGGRVKLLFLFFLKMYLNKNYEAVGINFESMYFVCSL